MILTNMKLRYVNIKLRYVNIKLRDVNIKLRDVRVRVRVIRFTQRFGKRKKVYIKSPWEYLTISLRLVWSLLLVH